MGLFRNHFQLNSARSPVRSRLRSFSSTRSTHPSTVLIGRSPWKPIIARDAGGRWSVAGLTSAWRFRVKRFGGPVMRPSPTSHATAFLQSVLGESESIHSRTLGLWRMCSLVLPGVRLVVGVRRVGGGDPLSSEYQPSGLAIAMVETLQRVVGRGGGLGAAANVASSMVPNDRVGSN